MLQGLSYPKLHHPELQALFEHDMTIPHDLVRPLFDLPRATLIPDLCAMIKFAGENGDILLEGELEDIEFIYHALWMLVDLNAIEALPNVLDFLRGDNGATSHVLECDDIWEVLFALGQDSFTTFKAFILDDTIGIYSRTAVARAVSQMGLHLPEKREAAIEWFRDLFEIYIGNPEQFKANYEEIELISFVSCSVSELQADVLLPQIKKSYALGLISYGVTGDWNEFQQHYIKDANAKIEIPKDIYAQYERAIMVSYYQEKIDPEGYKLKEKERIEKQNEAWAKLFQETESRLKKELEPKKAIKPVTSYLNQPKVSRNDDCPCGSGKKYKRCCGK